MKKVALILIFIFIILPIILIGIVGADVYLTVTNFSPDKVSVNTSQPTVSLSSDNTTLSFAFSVNLTTPQAGFIPKGALATIKLFYTNGSTTTQIGEPLQLTLELGKTSSNSINQSIILTSELTKALSQGQGITVTVKTGVQILLFGFVIPYTFNVPDQNFTLP